MNSLRWTIFRRMSTIPRHALQVRLENVSLGAFELLFCSFGAQAEEQLVSDSDDEDEPVCTKKVVRMNSFEQVRQFASLHELQHRQGPVQGACQAAKVHKASGEVSIMIPPLEARWWTSASGGELVKVSFSYGVVNAMAGVIPLDCAATMSSLSCHLAARL